VTALCGILLLDKPREMSSSGAVQRVRRAFGRIKAGHTGSLDPLATGMLPICLGEATKVAGYLLEGDKQYLFTARLGSRTTTGDLEGAVAETAAVPADVRQILETVSARFVGPISQIPPMYSAIKQGGQPLYRLARQGIEVERAARHVEIRSLSLMSAEGLDFTFRVLCSKGTYVRTLAEDMARAAGTVAHLTLLRREFSQPFAQEAMVSIEQLEANPAAVRLLPADAALLHLGRVELDDDAARRLGMGQSVAVRMPGIGADDLVRVYSQHDRFLGVGRKIPGETLKPVRLFNHSGVELT
jgi:tRNA pseudouridine55 synthase